MKAILLTGTALIALAASAVAAPTYTTQATIGYDPNAPTSNFNSPTNVANLTGYVVRTATDSTTLYVDVSTAGQPGSGSYPQFANIYLGGTTFSGIIIAATSSQAYNTNGNGTAYDLSSTGYTFTSTPGDIAFSLPFSFFETDPLNMGFTKQNPGDFMRISYSQSFGYTFTGGTPLYGNNRLGAFFVPAADVPEPLSIALLGAGAAAVVVSRRRRSAAAAT